MQEVNINYVLGLEEQKDLTLKMIQIDIPKSSVVINELKAMIENPNRNLYDMSSFFYRKVQPIKSCYKYCFPKDYNYAFLSDEVTYVPEDIIYSEYAKTNRKLRNAWEKSLINKKLYSKTELEDKWNKYVHQKEYPDKNRYFLKAEKYILCQNLYLAIQEARHNPKVKIYSRDIVGRKHFLYDINEDVKVDVFTNFGYGKRVSHLYLTIKYKDIVLIPYSDLIHYYYADMKSLISHTRAYRCRRHSWSGMMEFLADFVNKSRRNPKTFVRNYILNEINEMMKGLRAVHDNPSEILKNLKTRGNEYIRMSVIRPFDNDDFVLYETIPDELTTVFKIEKISGALHFIENLQSLIDICPKLNPIISEIIEMNRSIAPDIPTVLASIKKSIHSLQNKYNRRDKLYVNKEKEKDRLEKLLNRRLKLCKSIEAEEKSTAAFNKQYPEYKQLCRELNKLSQEMWELNRNIERRKKLRNRVIDCTKEMDVYLKN